MEGGTEGGVSSAAGVGQKCNFRVFKRKKRELGELQ